jgi:hypothetical protein
MWNFDGVHFEKTFYPKTAGPQKVFAIQVVDWSVTVQTSAFILAVEAIATYKAAAEL